MAGEAKLALRSFSVVGLHSRCKNTPIYQYTYFDSVRFLRDKEIRPNYRKKDKETRRPRACFKRNSPPHISSEVFIRVTLFSFHP